MALDSDLLNNFKKITGFNLQRYFLVVEEVSKSHFGRILEYFTGRSLKVPMESLVLLDSLSRQSKSLDHIINLHSSRFETTDYWDLLEMIESIKTKLETMQNSSKWSRASITLAKRVDTPEVDIRLRQEQTIERLAGGELGYVDEHQDWYSIAIRNDLQEEGYTTDGGVKLFVSQSGGSSFDIKSVVDIIDKETIKGKDLKNKLTFSSEDNDLEVVVGDSCFIQSVENLFRLRKGDNPEYVNQGLAKDLVTGQNLNSISYPTLVRQITETLSLDDTIDSFSIVKIEKNQDSIFIEVDITAKNQESFNIRI